MVGGATADEVSVGSLLPEMVDMGNLAHRAKPAYKEAQASSYDRASKDPSDLTTWFANGDNGQFIRTEDRNGHKEYVMADLTGPGAVVRMWSANPAGVYRFYFDGSTTPLIEVKAADLLQGKFANLGDPFGYNASSGCNLYFPFPYEKSLKITVDDSDNNAANHLYYHFGYRTYEAGTKVKTFSMDDLKSNSHEMDRVADILKNGLKEDAPLTKLKFDLGTGYVKDVFKVAATDRDKGNQAVSEFKVRLSIDGVFVDNPDADWTSSDQIHNALRQTRLLMSFDDEPCVDVPLGDFFGSAPGINPLKTLPFQVTADGWMTCRWIMPFKKSAQISIRNDGPRMVKLETQIATRKFKFNNDSYHFKAQWTIDTGSTRPMRDMHFLHVDGEGTWLGSNLHVANTGKDWWGEGDEKAYVDGEAFPSTFGTGSEDYYGYAWGSAALFNEPYHAQPRADGPGSHGHVSVSRYHIFDTIPFTQSFRFDLEEWHWDDCQCNFARTAYWYALPGGTPPIAVDTANLLPPLIEKPKPIKGALEGEKLRIVSKTGGETELQEFGDLSNGKQLWWRDAKVGDKLVLELPVLEAGTYDLSGNFCFAKDYGIHQITVNGVKVAQPIDFYSDGLKWDKKSLGTFQLPQGTITIEIEVAGQNEKALPNHMFGLDYFLLTKQS